MHETVTKIIEVITSIITLFTLIFTPAEKIYPEFPVSETKPKATFNEGEFVYGMNDIIVSPDGNDNNPGTPDKPIKSIEKAKELVKSRRGNITVWFREGTYQIDKTIEFITSDKSGVIYRSYPNENVVFTGSRPVTGWSETTVNGVRAFITDMPVNNDDDYFRSMFKDGKRLPRSCFPKEGVFKIADPNLSEAVEPIHDPQFFTHSMAFTVHTKDMLDFSNVTDIDVRIMHFWCDELLPVHSVNSAIGRIETTKPSSMTVRVNDNYIFENVKEALSLPGEWYLDRTEEKLYYIPEEGDTVDNTVLYAGVTEQLITFSNVSDISFQGINFENTDWEQISGLGFAGNFSETNPLFTNLKYESVHPQAAYEIPAAISISDSSEINFTDCRFENISFTAIKFEKNTENCNVTTCRFNEIGANAVFIHGDFVMPATTRNINITDCHISRYGRIFNNAIGILLTHASDCNLTNNEIHDGWYTGISVGWNWGYTDHPTQNININKNKIYNIGNGWLSDMGGIYTLGIQPGTVISENIIYNVGCYDGEYGYGGWGIYLDEGSSEILVERNLVYDCSSQTFHQHYGKDNIIKNNIFAFGGSGAFIITRHEEHNSLTLKNNILVVDNKPIYAFNTDADWFTDDSNVYHDYSRTKNVYSGSSMNIDERKSIVILTAQGLYKNANYTDPYFKDAENRDFTLALNSPALESGFEPWEYNAGTITEIC